MSNLVKESHQITFLVNLRNGKESSEPLVNEKKHEDRYDVVQQPPIIPLYGQFDLKTSNIESDDWSCPKQ